jgi:hypothetical protein
MPFIVNVFNDDGVATPRRFTEITVDCVYSLDETQCVIRLLSGEQFVCDESLTNLCNRTGLSICT